MIQRIKNRSLITDIKTYDVVLLIMNINNSMSKGFLRDIAVNFPSVRKKEIKSGYGDKRKYGCLFQIDDIMPLCACYAIRNGKVDDKHLNECLAKVAELYSGKKIASVLVGNESIYEKHFGGVDTQLSLYDDVTIGYEKLLYHKNKELRKKFNRKEITRDEFVKESDKIQWERFHGIYNPMPEGWTFERKDSGIFRIK